MKLKSTIAMTAIAAALMGVGGAASAATLGSDGNMNPLKPCSTNWSRDLNVIACSGWWDGNILSDTTVGTGNAGKSANLLSALNSLVDPDTFSLTSPYLEKVDNLRTGVSNYLLTGVSIIGIHYGGYPGVGNATILLKINAGPTGFKIDKTMVPGGETGGPLSGYAVFSTGGQCGSECSNVPVPGTIALLGLGMLGLGAARRKLA